MDIEEIAREIFGDGWQYMRVKEKDLVYGTLNWCVANKKKIPVGEYQKSPFELLMEAIDEALVDIYGTRLQFYMRRDRSREVVDVRNMIFRYVYFNTGYNYHDVARKFGYSRATIIHSLEQVDALRRYDKNFAEAYDKLDKTIKEKCRNRSI